MRNFESSNPFSRTCVSKLLRCEKFSHASTSRVYTDRTAKGQLITARTSFFEVRVNNVGQCLDEEGIVIERLRPSDIFDVTLSERDRHEKHHHYT